MAAYLGVEEYDLAEQKAMARLPNRAVQAAQPVLFGAVGYPTRVRHESELIKYVDVMHELSFESRFASLLQGLTESEFDLVRDLTTSVNDFGQERFGQKCLTRASMVESFNVYRHIRYMFGDARPRIFEIGPGCGYLGAMLIRDGYPYAATDVTQAFYLYQSHLWNFVSKGNLDELADRGNEEESFQAPEPGKATHVPWWKFIGLIPDTAPQFDVVTCNHTLCEMHPDSLGFALNITRTMLNGGGPDKAFVFHHWGSDRHQSHASVTQRFYSSDFVLVHNDPQITVMAPRDTQGRGDFLPLPSKKIPRKLWLRNSLRRLAGSATPRGNTGFEPLYYRSSHSPMSQAIVTTTEVEKPSRTVSIDSLNDFYTELLGTKEHSTQDERFLKLASGVKVSR